MSEPIEKYAITPDARLGDLLERWPHLEQVLIDLSPHFRALKNPVLRRTVARVATLRQVSTVSGVALGTLIDRLRAATGGEGGSASATCASAATAADAAAEAPPPSWAVAARVSRRHDARAAIEAGEHPMPKVMGDLASLGEGEVYELVTAFVPAPLLDVAREKGFAAHSVREGENLVRTYFTRAQRA